MDAIVNTFVIAGISAAVILVLIAATVNIASKQNKDKKAL